MKPKALILAGDGMNCENETAAAFERAGADAKIIPLNELASSPRELDSADILALPGGFSYGDEIHSGQVYALKLKTLLMGELKNFLSKDKLVLGVCNGFQILIKLGLLPDPAILDDSSKSRIATLTNNSGHHFIDRWEKLKTEKSVCVWTQGLDEYVSMPIRHGEGKLVFSGDQRRQYEIYTTLKQKGQIVFTYLEDVNGSYEKVAGLTDPTGRILGLMPHPEAALREELNPLREGGVPCLKIFQNAVEHSLIKIRERKKGNE